MREDKDAVVCLVQLLLLLLLELIAMSICHRSVTLHRVYYSAAAQKQPNLLRVHSVIVFLHFLSFFLRLLCSMQAC